MCCLVLTFVLTRFVLTVFVMQISKNVMVLRTNSIEDINKYMFLTQVQRISRSSCVLKTQTKYINDKDNNTHKM